MPRSLSPRAARAFLVSALLALLLLVPAATAQPAETDGPAAEPDTVRTASSDSLTTVALDPIVVTATRTQQALDNVTVPVSVLTREDIDSRSRVRLSDLLQEETTFQFDYS